MANRDESDARQHETLPGPGPGPNPPLGDSGVHPVEQMVDAAIERIARQQDAPSEQVQQPASLARRTGKTPTRLRWKGLDVSDEFRNYAERIARGEDLPPFEGRVLAEPNPAFPWGSTQDEPGRKSRVALWSSALIVLGLLGWAVALKLGGPAPDDPRQPITLQPAALQPAALRPSTAAPNEPGAAARPALATPPEGVERDTVEAPALEALAATAEAASVSGSPAPVPVATPGENAPAAPPSAAVVHASLASAVSEEVAPPGAQALTPSGTTSNEAVGAELAREGTSPPAAGGVVAGGDGTGAATVPVAAGAAAASEAAREDDFGIMSLPYPAPTAPAAPSAPSGAKSSASVGDLANGRQAPAGAVRKEPGSESSAKGSLLVESPSF